MAKNLILGLIQAQQAHIRAAKTFLQKSGSVIHQNVMVSYHHVQYQKKTNGPILKECSDGQTDRRTDRRTETGESDFIGRSPTNVERLKQRSNTIFYNISCDFICKDNFLNMDSLPGIRFLLQSIQSQRYQRCNVSELYAVTEDLFLAH